MAIVNLVSILAIQLKREVVTGNYGTHEINAVIKPFVVFVFVIVVKQSIKLTHVFTPFECDIVVH
jgi:hypothetical protein